MVELSHLSSPMARAPDSEGRWSAAEQKSSVPHRSAADQRTRTAAASMGKAAATQRGIRCPALARRTQAKRGGRQWAMHGVRVGNFVAMAWAAIALLRAVPVTGQASSDCLTRTETATQRRPFFTRVGSTIPVSTVEFLIPEAFNGTGLVRGAVAGTVAASDADSTDSLFFELRPSAVSGLFATNSSGRTVTVTATEHIDFESNLQEYDLTVRVFDRDPSGAEFGSALCADVSIDVVVLDANDHRPTFSRSVYRASVREDAGVGFNTNAMRVAATDRDTGLNGRFRFAIIAGNEDGKFRIGRNSGQVRTNGTLDFEQRQNYSLTIQATDLGSPQQSATVLMNITVIDVNDNAPVLVNSTLVAAVLRNASAGTPLARFAALDADTEANGQVFFALTQESYGASIVTNPAQFRFAVNRTSGEVILNGTLCDAVAFRTSQITVLVLAFDGGAVPLQTFGTLVVAVSELAPEPFTAPGYSRTIEGDTPGGTPLLNVSVGGLNDVCANPAGVVYTLVPSETSRDFAVGRTTGALSLQRQIEPPRGFVGTLTLILVVIATENTFVQPRTVRANITITVNFLDTETEVDATFSHSGSGFLLGSAQHLANGTDRHNFGVFIDNENVSTATVSMMWGGLQLLGTTAPRQRRAAVTATVTTLSQEVRSVDRRVRAEVALRDVYGSARVAQTVVTARVFPEVALRVIDSTPITASCTVQGTTIDGTCALVFSVPPIFFQPAELREQRAHTAQLFYTLGGVEHLVSTVTLVPDLVLNSSHTVQNTAAVVSTTRAAYPGQTARVTVSARATFELTVFTVVLTHDERVVTPTLPVAVDPTRWSITATRAGPRTVVVGTATTSHQLSDSPATAVESLFGIDFDLATSGPIDELPHTMVNLTIDQLIEHRNGAVAARPPLYVDDRGVGASGARIGILHDSRLGIVPFSPRRHLFNTALLHGGSTSATISARACHSCLRSAPIQRGALCGGSCVTVPQEQVRCSTPSPSLLGLDRCRAFLSPSHTVGAAGIPVNITFNGSQAQVGFHTWAVDLPVRITVARGQSLRALSGFRSGSQCAPAFQAAFVSVLTNVSSGTVRHGVDLTPRVLTQLHVQNESIAGLEVGNGTGSFLKVRGRAPGSTLVRLLRGTTVLGSASVGVSSDVANPVRLQLFIRTYSGLQLIESGSTTTNYGRFVASADQLATVLRSPGQQLGLVAVLHSTDGGRTVLSRADGLIINSSNAAVLAVRSDARVATALASGNATLTAFIDPGSCRNTALFTRQAVEVVLDDPSSIEVSITHRRLAATAETASALGLPTSTSVSITLIYPSGTRVAYTGDSRVQLVDSSLVSLQNSSTNGFELRANTAGRSGVATVTVTLTDMPTAVIASLPGNNITVTVVTITSSRIFATPFPEFSGSQSQSATILNRYAASAGSPSTFQQAVLQVSLGLSDSTQVNVTSAVQYRASVVSGNSIAFSLSASSGGRSVVTVTAAAEADIEATVGTFRSTSIRITATIDPVFATSLTFIGRLTTLRGIQNVGGASADVAAVFSDGTQVSSLVPSGVPRIRGLLAFSLANASGCATVNSATGRLTVRANSISSTSIVASAQGASAAVAAVLEFVCNLDPGLGDVDIGDTSGLPIGAVAASSEIAVQVRVNTGAQPIGPFEIDFVFNEALIEPQNVSVGADLASTGGVQSLLGRVNDPPGRLLVVGVPVGRAVRGAAVHLFTITFIARNTSGVGHITGTVRRMVEPGVATNVTIIGTQGREFIAGNVSFDVRPQRRRTRRSFGVGEMGASGAHQAHWIGQYPSTARSRRQQSCLAARLGDTNADCVYDVVDVGYTAEFVVESLVGFQGTFGAAYNNSPPSALARVHMDADQNQVIDAADVLRLSRGLVGQTRFVRSTATASVNYHSGCTLRLQATVTKGDGTADTSAPNRSQTLVYFVLASNSSAFPTLFDRSIDTCTACSGTILRGRATSLARPVTTFGGLIAARRSPNDASVYFAAISTDLTNAAVGTIGLSVVTVTRDVTLSTDASRMAFHAGPSTAVRRPDFVDDLVISLTEVNLQISVRGHSPKAFVNNSFASSRCINVHAPQIVGIPVNQPRISERAPLGSLLFTFNATDADLGDGGRFNLSVSELNAQNAVQFNTTSGTVTTTRLLARGTYSLQVVAVDQAPPFNRNVTNVSFVVTATSISFVADPYTTQFPETAAIGSALLSNLQVRTEQGALQLPSPHVAFSIVNRSDQGRQLVNISNTTGSLFLQSAIDFEETSSIALTISVRELAFPFNNATAVVFLNVTEVFTNEERPVFEQDDEYPGDTFTRRSTGEALYEVSISAFLPGDVPLVRISANDTEDFENGTTPTLRLLDASRLSGFRFDPADGLVSTTGELPLQTSLTTHIFQIEARDFQGATTVANVSISVAGDFLSNFIRNDYTLSGGRLGFVGFGPPLLDASEPFAPIPAPALRPTVRAILGAAVDGLSFDRRTCRIAVQTFDSARGSSIGGQSVRVHVVPSQDLTADLLAGRQAAALGPFDCTTRGVDGTCIVTITFPIAWFSNLRSALRTSDLRVGVSSASSTSANLLGSISLHRRATVSVQRSVVVELPQRSLAAGDQVTVTVKANGGFSIAAWQLRLQVDERLQIVRAVVDQRQWTSQTQSPSATVFDITGFLADESSASSGQVSGYENLFSLVLRVRTIATACNSTTGQECLTISGNTVRLSSVRDAEVAVNQPIVFQDRFSPTSGAQSGRITTYSNRLAGAFTAVGRTEILNTARLDGVAISVPLSILGLTQYGTNGLQVVPTSLKQCSSSNAAAIKVAADCTLLFVDGSETTAGNAAGTAITVRVTEGGVNVAIMSFNASTWHPATPVDLRVTSSRLHRIVGLSISRSGTCSPGYQTAVVTAFANFSNGARTIPHVRVTKQVVRALVSTQTSVVQIADGVVAGVGAGTAQVVLQHSNAGPVALGSTTVNVVNDAVSPTSLIVSVAKELDIGEVGGATLRSPFDLGREQVYTMVPNNTLSVVDDVGGVTVFARFEGQRDLMQVRPTDGLRLQVNANSIEAIELPEGTDSVRHSRVVAVSSQDDAQVNATWGSCGGGVIASGAGFVDVRTAPPIRVDVELQHSDLTIPNDPLTLRGFRTSTSFAVYLIFATASGERRKPVTNDTRTLFSVSSATQFVRICDRPVDGVCRGATGQITSVANASAGAVRVTISFTNVNLTATLDLRITTTRSVDIALNPFPEYAGSRAFQVQTLHRYLNSFSGSEVYQQARLYISATMSNGTSFSVPESAASFSLSPGGVVSYNSGSRVLSNQLPPGSLTGQNRSVTIGCTIGRVTCTPTSLRVSRNGVRITQLDPPRLQSQRTQSRSSYNLVGLNGTFDQIVLGATFSDGSKHPQLFSGTGVPLLDGLIGFTSALSRASSVSSTGRVTLHNNHHNTVGVSVSVRGDASVSAVVVQLACNLNAAGGDVDIGAASGVPLGPSRAGQTLTVPIRVNSGGVAIGAVEVLVRYNPLDFERVGSIARGSHWPGGVFEAVDDPPGTILVGGSPTGTYRGSALELAIVRLRVRRNSATPVSLTGEIRTLNEPPSVEDLGGRAIGGAAPRPILAGAIQVALGSRRLARRSNDRGGTWAHGHFDASRLRVRSRRQAALCGGTLPCASCNGVREQGDVNGDCVFDLRDVSFVQVYILEAVSGFRSTRGQTIQSRRLAFQLVELDADRDGTISALDARFLARVNFGLLRFIKEIAITPVQDFPLSLGLLTVNVTLQAKGNVQTQSDASQVYLDFGHPSAATAEAFAATTAERGRVVTTSKGAGLYGMIVATQRVGPLYNASSTASIPTLCTLSASVGSSCQPPASGQPALRFAYNRQAGSCESFQYAGCNGNANSFASSTLCRDMCQPTYTHSTVLNTSVAADDVGLSVLIVTFTSQGAFTSGRSEFITTAVAGGTPVYPRTLQLQLAVQASTNAPPATIDIGPINGYSPLLTFNNSAGSEQFVNAFVSELPANQTNLTVVENSANGTTIVRFVAIDGDFNGSAADAPFTYSFEGPGGSIVQRSGAFLLNRTSGQLTLVAPLDYENTSSPTIALRVVVNDNGLPISRSSVTAVIVSLVDLNDNAPVFTLPVYSFTASIAAGPGVVGRVVATDRDSNTVLGGNNSGIIYSIVQSNSSNCSDILSLNPQSGNISVTRALNRSLGLLCVLQVRAANEGNATTPATAFVSVRFVNNDFAVSITVDANVVDFLRQPPNSTCLRDLEQLVGGSITIIEAVASALSPSLRTEVVFFASNRLGHTLDASELTRTLLQNSPTLGRLQCSGWNDNPRSDDGHDAGVAFYTDGGCAQPVGWNASAGPPLATLNDTFVFEAYGRTGPPHRCLGQAGTGVAARISCAGVSAGNASVRFFFSDVCAPPTYIVNGSDYTADGSVVDNYDCVEVESPTPGAPPLFARVFCEDIIITSTTTTTSTGTSSSTTSSSTTTATVTSTTATETTTTGTSSSVTISTQTSSTSTHTLDNVNLGAAERANSESGFPLWIVVGCALAVLLCWVIAMIVVVRHRRRKDTQTLVSPANPMSGDVVLVSADGEPITGGVVTETGAVATFSGEEQQDAAMHNVRFNPMTAFANLQDAGLMDPPEENDSLGDLSDFDEADFEEFADSLLQTDDGTEDLFGQLAANLRRTRASGGEDSEAASTPKKRVSFAADTQTARRNDPRFSTVLPTSDSVSLDLSDESDADDDLSDFENDEDGDDGTDESDFTDLETDRIAASLRPERFELSSLPNEPARSSYTPRVEHHDLQVAAAASGPTPARMSAELDAIATVAEIEYSDIMQNVVYT